MAGGLYVGGTVVDWGEVDDLIRSGDFAPPRECAIAPYLMDATQTRAAIKASSWRFYVYLLCGPGGEIFYVGKGAGPRALVHAAEAAAGADGDKTEMLRRLGNQVRYCILAFFEDDDEALLEESILIEALWPVLLNSRKDTAFSTLKHIECKNLTEDAQAVMDLALEFEAMAQKLRAKSASLLEASSAIRRMKQGGNRG